MNTGAQIDTQLLIWHVSLLVWKDFKEKNMQKSEKSRNCQKTVIKISEIKKKFSDVSKIGKSKVFENSKYLI